MSRPPPRLRSFAACWIALGVAALAYNRALYGIDEYNRSPEHRIAPELELGLAVVWWLLPLGWFAWVVYRTRAHRGGRLRLLSSAVGVQLALTLVLAAATTATHWYVTFFGLFEPRSIGTARAPDTGAAFYLYQDGAGCAYRVYERAPWSFVLRRVDHVATTGCRYDQPPYMQWDAAAGRFEVILTNENESVGGSGKLIWLPFH